MSVGNFLAGAGNVGTGMRQAEQEAQLARTRQHAIQAENRRVAGLRESAQVGTGLNPEPVVVPDYKAQAAGHPMPARRSYTPEQRAQMRESMTPDDRAIALYGQGTTPAPGQQPAPSANPPPTAQGVSPAPAQQPGLAASPPPAWQPAPRGPDGMAAGVTLPTIPAPAPAAPQQAATPPPISEALPGAAGVFRRGADEFAAANQPRSRSGQMGRGRQRSNAAEGAPPPVPPPAKPAEEPKAEPAKEPPKGPAASALTATGGAGVKQQSKAATPENPSAFYAAHPESIAADRRRLDDTYQRMRDSAYKRAEIANRYGQTEKLEQMQQTVLMLDAQYEATARMLEGQHAVSMFEYADDPRAMGMILSSQLDGTPVGFSPRDDGTWDLFIGEGNHSGTYSKADITSMVREFTDVNYRETMAATMSEVAMKNLENELKIKFMLSEVEAQTLQAMVVEAYRTQRALAVANIAVGAKEFSVGMTPDSELYIVDKTTQQVHFVDPNRGVFKDSPAGPLQVAPQTRGTSFP